jgi:hypothetical protein
VTTLRQLRVLLFLGTVCFFAGGAGAASAIATSRNELLVLPFTAVAWGGLVVGWIVGRYSGLLEAQAVTAEPRP